MTKKTGNTGAKKLLGRTHPMLHGIYQLYRLLEDNSTKSYGEEKTHRNSTNNTDLHPMASDFFFEFKKIRISVRSSVHPPLRAALPLSGENGMKKYYPSSLW